MGEFWGRGEGGGRERREREREKKGRARANDNFCRLREKGSLAALRIDATEGCNGKRFQDDRVESCLGTIYYSIIQLFTSSPTIHRQCSLQD